MHLILYVFFFNRKKEGQISFLVNGVNEQSYYYCSTSRKMDMCGEEGKHYKKNRNQKIKNNNHI